VGDVEKQCDGDRVSVLDLRVRVNKMDEGSGRTRDRLKESRVGRGADF
jgi:hypothetical protein